MSPAVLLRHELPDGSWHYDWMIQRPPSFRPVDAGEVGQPRLITFRTEARIDDPDVAFFDARRLGDHRAEYLNYEGEVSGGRGKVSRIIRGELQVDVERAEAFWASGYMGARRALFRGELQQNGVWQFEVVST